MIYFWSISVALLLLSSHLHGQQVPDCSRTVWGGPSGPGKDCIFPFILNGIKYTMCTTANEGSNRPWCPTKLDKLGRVDIVSNHFGYCDPNCPYENQRGIIQTTTTTVRPARPTPIQARPTQPPRRTQTTPRTTTLKTIIDGNVDWNC